MRRARSAARLALLPALVLPVVLATAACTATSHVSHCTNATCAISLTGEQTLQVELGSLERDLRVKTIEPNAVTLSARADSSGCPQAGPRPSATSPFRWSRSRAATCSCRSARHSARHTTVGPA